ncbi:MAG: peroxiredoxin Q/BCP [Brevundimonas sp.]|jgi:peroxiredoxin Q/BCP|tara:strand:+ start:4982 stop:5431 length:450 start_codon:yes stop_codon:yes gene_type:complete
MNKINPTSCVATSNQEIQIPDSQGRNIVLYFYPKDDTPGCTIEGNDFTRLHESFSSNNTVIYGVSRDSIKSHEKFREKFNYTIDLISDEDESLCKLFDVIKLKKLYGKEHMGIERSTFVISPSGDILKEWIKVKVDGHAEEVLEFVSAL